MEGIHSHTYLPDERPELKTQEPVFIVPMADLTVVRNESLLLCTYPLGACLGIVIHDPKAKVAGLLHSMLPDSKLDPSRAMVRPGMFLDTGLAAMLQKAYDYDAQKENILVYVAGGGRILDSSASFNIGMRNYEVLTACLTKHGLKIHVEDVGGLTNRTLLFNTAKGEVRLKVSGEPEEKVLCKR